jgi:cellulose synthase/poly-beta-1,6-N-acetylglucosamine synthase-like glycosyltransferase
LPRAGTVWRSLLRPIFPRHREKLTFALVGASVAVLGRVLLDLLVAAGCGATIANGLQAVVTLQVNFLANRHLTWRERISGARVGLLGRWGRFQLARGAGLLVCVGLFPLAAPLVGRSVAYWGLLAAGAAANFLTDKYWSFSPARRAPTGRHAAASRRRRVLALGAVLLALLLLSAAFLDQAIVVASLSMLLVAVTTLAFQLYNWWRPENSDQRRYGEPDEPRLPGAILVPMRHEEAVAGQTLDRLARLHHPDYWVVPIVDHPDDPGTAAIAHAKAREHPGKVLVCPYPEETEVHNKPIGLNAAMEMLHDLGIPFEWVGVADAEDLFHPDLLRMVDYRFRTSGAGIVQCGVQLMNFSSDPRALPLPSGRLARLRRWWRAHASAWWRAANVLEYFKWFQSRLRLQAATGVMPLGGNTVFFRRQFLDALHRRSGTWWDERCLTEDCKIGIVASVLGFDVDVVYLDELVTHEETPADLAGFVRQRVRWMQGFIQVFAEGEWRRLPTMTQRVLAVYVLGFQFFQAAAGLLAPAALALALLHKAPVLVTLLATVPLAIGLLNVVLDLLLLAQFGRTFRQRVRLRDLAGVALGAYPFQVVLSVAAVWATGRFVLGRSDWVKTIHTGTHLRTALARAARPAMVDEAA